MCAEWEVIQWIELDSWFVKPFLGLLHAEYATGLGDLDLKIATDDNLLLFQALDSDGMSWAIRNNVFSRTPPYLSNIAEIAHATVPGNAYLVIASDGLADLIWRDEERVLGQVCAEAVSRQPAPNYNPASEVLWHAWGRRNEGNLNSLLNGEKLVGGRVDDITVVVVSL